MGLLPVTAVELCLIYAGGKSEGSYKTCNMQAANYKNQQVKSNCTAAQNSVFTLFVLIVSFHFRAADSH